MAPFAELLLTPPAKVQRNDGVRVDMTIMNGNRKEMAPTTKLFFSEFFSIVPLIGQAVYTEAVMVTFQSLWFNVRARALGSFLSGVVAMIGGNLLGISLPLEKERSSGRVQVCQRHLEQGNRSMRL
jgi:hypothetical protein